MEPGCGLETKLVRGRRYLYFWKYERRDGRSRKVDPYLGPVTSPKARERAVRMLLDHESRAAADLSRRIDRYRQALARWSSA